MPMGTKGGWTFRATGEKEYDVAGHAAAPVKRRWLRGLRLARRLGLAAIALVEAWLECLVGHLRLAADEVPDVIR